MTPGRRTISVGIVAALVVVLATLNVVGVLRYPGGPLRDRSDDGLFWLDTRPSDQGMNSVGFRWPDAAWATVGTSIYFGNVTFHNPWPWDATVEAITPIDPSPGLVVRGVYISRPGISSDESVGLGIEPVMPPGFTFEQAFASPPVAVKPATGLPSDDAKMLLVLTTDRPGPMTFEGLNVEYRVGPLTFRSVQYMALHGCVGPLTANVTCSETDAWAGRP